MFAILIFGDWIWPTTIIIIIKKRFGLRKYQLIIIIIHTYKARLGAKNRLKPIDLHTGESSIAVVKQTMHKSLHEGVGRVCCERMPDDTQLTQMVEASSCNVVDVNL